jgi:uncharacterized membrane protein YjjP (DUF1212 family)
MHLDGNKLAVSKSRRRAVLAIWLVMLLVFAADGVVHLLYGDWFGCLMIVVAAAIGFAVLTPRGRRQLLRS